MSISPRSRVSIYHISSFSVPEDAIFSSEGTLADSHRPPLSRTIAWSTLSLSGRGSQQSIQCLSFFFRPQNAYCAVPNVLPKRIKKPLPGITEIDVQSAPELTRNVMLDRTPLTCASTWRCPRPLIPLTCMQIREDMQQPRVSSRQLNCGCTTTLRPPCVATLSMAKFEVENSQNFELDFELKPEHSYSTRA